METATVSKRNVQTDIALAIATVRPEIVVFHPRTVSYGVFRDSSQNFKSVHPVFVFESLHSISVDCEVPPTIWQEFLTESAEGNCSIYYCTPSWTRIVSDDAYYYSAIHKLERPLNRDPSLSGLLVYGDVRPSRNPLAFVEKVLAARFPNTTVYLSLGDASGTQAGYRASVVELFRARYPDLVVLPLLRHDELLQFAAKKVSTFVSLNSPWRFSTTTYEMAELGISTWGWHCNGSDLVPVSSDENPMMQIRRMACRAKFWESVCKK